MKSPKKYTNQLVVTAVGLLAFVLTAFGPTGPLSVKAIDKCLCSADLTAITVDSQDSLNFTLQYRGTIQSPPGMIMDNVIYSDPHIVATKTQTEGCDSIDNPADGGYGGVCITTAVNPTAPQV